MVAVLVFFGKYGARFNFATPLLARIFYKWCSYTSWLTVVMMEKL